MSHLAAVALYLVFPLYSVIIGGHPMLKICGSRKYVLISRSSPTMWPFFLTKPMSFTPTIDAKLRL